MEALVQLDVEELPQHLDLVAVFGNTYSALYNMASIHQDNDFEVGVT